MWLNTSRLYHFFLCLLGIRIKFLDFSSNEIDRKTSNSPRNRFFKWISAIIFLIFTLIYPTCVSNIVSYSPTFANKKRIEFYVVTLSSYIRFVTVSFIFILEFVFEKRAKAYQNVIKRDIIQIQHIYSYWFVRLKGRTFKLKNWNDSLAKLTNLNTGRGLVVIFIMIVYNAFIAVRLVYNIDQVKNYQFFETCIIYTPNLISTLFIWHLSDIFVQYTKMFSLLDEIIKVIAKDIWSQLSMRAKKHNRFKYFVVATMNEHKLNTAINHLATIMECHNNLKNHLLEMRNLYSLQSNIVVLSDFVNIIFEVKTVFNISIEAKNYVSNSH